MFTSCNFVDSITIDDTYETNFIIEHLKGVRRYRNMIIDRTKLLDFDGISTESFTGVIDVINYPDIKQLSGSIHRNITLRLSMNEINLENIQFEGRYMIISNNSANTKKVNISNCDIVSVYCDGTSLLDMTIDNCPRTIHINCDNIFNLNIKNCAKSITVVTKIIHGLASTCKVNLTLRGDIEILEPLKGVKSITIGYGSIDNVHVDALNVPHLVFKSNKRYDLSSFNLSKVTKLICDCTDNVVFGEDQVLPKLLSWTSPLLSSKMPECPRLMHLTILRFNHTSEKCKKLILDNVNLYTGGLSQRNLKFKISTRLISGWTEKIELDELYNALEIVQTKSARKDTN